MRRLLLFLITFAIMIAIGFALGRMLPGAGGEGQQSAAPQIITVPVLITATQDPNTTPQVMVITATPAQGTEIAALPEGVLEGIGDVATRAPAPTLNPDLISGDSVLQATVTALPENCILHVMEDGDTPFGIALTYEADPFALMEINGLDDERARFLDIGDVLIVPLEGCALTAQQVTAITGEDDLTNAEDSTTDAADSESTIEVTADPNVTVAPTMTLPATAVNAQVEIVRVVGAGDITTEGVEVRNTGGVVDLTNWTLEDSDGNVFTFPEQRLFTNGQVTVFTRRGTNTPIALFWGRSQATWGEPGETVTLSNAQGEAQATLRLSNPINLTDSDS